MAACSIGQMLAFSDAQNSSSSGVIRPVESRHTASPSLRPSPNEPVPAPSLAVSLHTRRSPVSYTHLTLPTICSV
eukprot:1528306-Rhodomonas_salina.3